MKNKTSLFKNTQTHKKIHLKSNPISFKNLCTGFAKEYYPLNQVTFFSQLWRLYFFGRLSQIHMCGLCPNELAQLEWELGVVVSKLGSQSNGLGFESRLLQILHGHGVKAMQGNREIKVAKWDTPTKTCQAVITSIKIALLPEGSTRAARNQGLLWILQRRQNRILPSRIPDFPGMKRRLGSSGPRRLRFRFQLCWSCSPWLTRHVPMIPAFLQEELFMFQLNCFSYLVWFVSKN